MSDDELVLKLKEGSHEAFEAIYASHAIPLMRHLYHLTGNQQEAEELLHESMMLMIQKINFYTPNPELPQSFKTWLYRLSTNRTIDEIRKKKSKARTTVSQEVTTHSQNEDLYQTKEQERVLSDLILKLPLLQRMVLSLRVQDDLSYSEISAVLGKDINSIKQGLFHARKNFRQLLEAGGET